MTQKEIRRDYEIEMERLVRKLTPHQRRQLLHWLHRHSRRRRNGHRHRARAWWLITGHGPKIHP